MQSILCGSLRLPYAYRNFYSKQHCLFLLYAQIAGNNLLKVKYDKFDVYRAMHRDIFL